MSILINLAVIAAISLVTMLLNINIVALNVDILGYQLNGFVKHFLTNFILMALIVGTITLLSPNFRLITIKK